MAYIHDLGRIKILVLRWCQGQTLMADPQNEFAVMLMLDFTDGTEQSGDFGPRQIVRKGVLKHFLQRVTMRTRNAFCKIMIDGGGEV
jgi:hypothetical protein